MTATAMTAVRDEQVDRLGELANIGAGHAAGAFSRLTGHTIRMHVPRVRIGGVHVEAAARSGTSGGEWESGVVFEFDGCLNAVMGVLFRRRMCDAVVRHLVGKSQGFLPPETIESALMEVGNVLASHVASAIADTLGARLLPSIPMLFLDGAFGQLETIAATRPGGGELWIECELVDSDGDLGGLVVLIPDREDV